MQNTITGTSHVGGVETIESSLTAVAWPAVWAGAFVATAVSVSLLFLGSALGFAFVSPWHAGLSPVAFTAASAIWLILMQWVSAAFGGYITGRMRTKWTQVHTDEVFFRDTANGFLTWAVATLATAIFATSILGALLHGGMHTAGMMGREMLPPAMPGQSPMAVSDEYFVDSMFRADRPSVNAPTPEVSAEATRILLNGVRHDGVSQEDKNYLTQLVIARTGVSQPEAQRRVDMTIDHIQTAEQKAKQAAQTAHKTAATVSLFTFLSLLLGAFIACVAAALGGARRDSY